MVRAVNNFLTVQTVWPRPWNIIHQNVLLGLILHSFSSSMLIKVKISGQYEYDGDAASGGRRFHTPSGLWAGAVRCGPLHFTF